ncbi:hypothetical protein ATN84_19515 [Paramesorhizobium deserti]|uniref:Hedgehog/Intein (Hint) domain-containing protein n=1 Tax=Paramesorhizobium deserti TaxID=1494590 RepID=A0A135HQJ9_9HYPH|nr:Hint domain-containing protein [Paramesorhizobium deserti]KXF75450.1 hypothetical protein ATN84_19515 [Paramesorhizobium deserti]
MSPTRDRQLRLNRARRHFLGVAIATGAKIAALGAVATTISSLPARALGTNWGKDPGGGGGAHCFLRGTSITTPTGEVRIEDLRTGDLVETVRGGAKAVKWIGRQNFRKSGPSWPESVVPVRIARHALDRQTPHRDLYLSPNHALFIDGVLIRVKELVNGRSIVPALPAGLETIEYFNIVFDTHEAVLAEGAPAETYLLGTDNYESFTNFVEFERLYPAEQRLAMVPFAPIVGYEGGRQHLKALLRLGASCLVPVRDPIREAYERIAARAELSPAEI